MIRYKQELRICAGYSSLSCATSGHILSCCQCLQSHPKFSSVEDLQPLLYSRALQKDTSKQPEAMSLKAAVSQRVIANETLAYFIGRTYLFLVRSYPTDACLALSHTFLAHCLAVVGFACGGVILLRHSAIGVSSATLRLLHCSSSCGMAV